MEHGVTQFGPSQTTPKQKFEDQTTKKHTNRVHYSFLRVGLANTFNPLKSPTLDQEV